ncbi:MAG: aldo/keto reductase [Planctomycetota bacterium]
MPIDHSQLRQLGNSDLRVSPVAFGAWPIAGVTSLEVNDDDSLDTLRACLDAGVNFIDAAYCYGPNGESERLIGRALGGVRDQLVIASKGGIHYEPDGSQAQDGRPETLLRECDKSLARMRTDRIDLHYLHSPDPNVPVAESAGAIAELIAAGKVRYAGASNCNLEQIQAFHAACPLTAVQLPYNMLQRGIEEQTLPWCREHNVGVCVYWALMKGLLAGKLDKQRGLDEADNRLKYPQYQGDEWERNLAFVERLRGVADRLGRTVAQLAVNWTVSQPGIDVALCGAKRRWQIEETAGSMGWRLSPEDAAEIESAIHDRGKAAAKRVFS